jgi:hypothetical protein
MGLCDGPPMWETMRDEDDELVLFTQPGKVQEEMAPFSSHRDLDGVHYQWQRNGMWVGEGGRASFEHFDEHGPAKTGILALPRAPAFSEEFDWNKRVTGTVLVLPFVEGLPSSERAKVIGEWVKRNSDRYQKTFVRLYHATAPTLPIEDQGLKPTSAARRRSFQSESGFVYLANRPARAKNFGDLGNGGRSVVYEVIVSVRDLRADLDQLSNQRAAGQLVGNSVGESIVYGGGARIKGSIEPWALRRLTSAEYVQIEERNRRVWQLDHLSEQPGLAPVFLQCARLAMQRSEHGPYDIDWRHVERSFVRETVLGLNQDEDAVRETILSCSPLAVMPSHTDIVDRDIAAALRERADVRSDPEQSSVRRMRPGR